jgi:thiol-disulfide isomerase/thioredoxin
MSNDQYGGNYMMGRKLLREKYFLGYTLLMVSLLLMILMPQYAMASDHPILYLFWGEGCPHCADEKEFLELLHRQYPEFEMWWFEIWDHPEFAKLADAMRKAYGEKIAAVPMTIIGDWVIVGFRSYEETGVQIEEQVKTCIKQGCSDAFDKIKALPIVTKIRDEAARNKPEDWELFPASPRKQEESQK